MDKIYMQFYKLIPKIQEFINTTDFSDFKNKQRTFNYLDWLVTKTDIIINEKDFIINKNVIPKTINQYVVKNLSFVEQAYIERFYNKINMNNNKHEYIIKNNIVLNNLEIIDIVKMIYLKRPYVVWINFGFNIDKEFGGKHPALILRRTGNSIYVLPLSSGRIPNNKKDKPYCGEIPFVYNLKPMKRWFNAYRVTCVSIQRIDFNSPIGRLQGRYLNKIYNSLDSIGIKGIVG